ncbi:hypothetical protein QYF36_018833 [Acer negundo]|nr:hypothetical protein QYF36_018833 [Acer negundo]
MIARMKEGSSVWELVLGMMSNFNTTEVNDNKSKAGEANIAESSSFGFKKRKRSAGKANARPKKKQVQSKKKCTTTDKVKGKCFHCDKVVHWKWNCLQ